MYRAFSRLLTAFILLLAVSLFSLNAQEQDKATTPLRKAILVLPLQVGQGIPAGQKYLGLGAQNLLESLLGLHSDLEEYFAISSYVTLFPQSKDLQAWVESWVESKANLPAGIEKLGLRYIVTGKIEKREQVITVDLELFDRVTNKSLKKSAPLDVPALVKFREGFLELLEQAGLPAPAAQKPKMLWEEALSVEALTALGESDFEVATVAPYQGEGGTYAPRPFEECAKIAPRSYLAQAGLGVLYFLQKKYAEGQKQFGYALELNSYGKGAASAMMLIGVRTGNEKDAEMWAARIAEISDKPIKFALLKLYAEQARKAQNEKQWEKAISHYERALLLSQETKSKQDEIDALFHLGLLNTILHRPKKVIEYFEQVLPSIDRLSPMATGLSLHYLADGYRYTGQHDKAIATYQSALAILQTLDDKSHLAITFDGIAESYAGLSQRNKAIDYHEQALAIWRSGKGIQPALRSQRERNTLFSLGGLYAESAQYDKAFESFNQALENARKQKADLEEFHALFQIGSTYGKMERYDKAVEYYLLSLPVSRKLPDRQSEALCLTSVGGNYEKISEFEKAIDYHEQALRIYQETGEKAGQATSLKLIGAAYSSISEYEKAIDYFERALTMNREINKPSLQYSTLSNLGLAYLGLSQYEKAIEYFEKALKLARDMNNKDAESTVLNNLGVAYESLSLFDKAKQTHEQSLVIERKQGRRGSEAYNLSNLGSVNLDLGDYEKAIEQYQKALAAAREVKNSLLESTLLHNIGNVYKLTAKYSEAVEYMRQAAAIQHKIKDKIGEASSIGNIARVYANLGQYEKAISSYQQMLAITRQVKSREYEANALSWIGDAHYHLGHYDEALVYAEQSRQIYQEIKNRAFEGRQLAELGQIHNAMGNYDRAMDYLNQALLIARALKVRDDEGRTYLLVGQVHANLKNYDKAIESFEQALLFSRETKNAVYEGDALKSLMRSWQALDRPKLAIFYGKQAVNIYQVIRKNIQALEKESQQSFIKSKEDTYRELADLLISQSRLPEAQQVLTVLKEDEYFDFIRRDGNAAKELLRRIDLGDDEREALRRYAERADNITAAQQKYDEMNTRANLTDEQKDQLKVLAAEINDAKAAFVVFLRQLSDEFGKEGQQKQADVDDSTALEGELSKWGDDVAALYTIVGEDNYRVILTTKQGRLWREANPKTKRADLDRMVLEFRLAVQNPNSNPRLLAQHLYQILVAPIAKDLEAAGTKTLLWSLDGTLRYLPIAALYDGKQYMVEKYANVIITLASRTRLGDEPVARWRGLGLGVSEKSEGFNSLYAVLDELRGIIRDETLKGKTGGLIPGRVMLDREFSEQAMLLALKKKYPIVHIASHFVFKPNDKESFLLLGGNEHLTLDRVKTISPRPFFEGVELLVLSACDTATGGGSNGKEVESFAVLAQRQGASAVIATLWPVADRSTQELMRRFYENRVITGGALRKKMTNATALRQAQLALLHNDIKGQAGPNRKAVIGDGIPEFKADPNAPYSHPYYWAPFVLIGNWK